jgi:hypothetical protein
MLPRPTLSNKEGINYGLTKKMWLKIIIIYSSFKKFPELAGIICRKAVVLFTGIAAVNNEMYIDILGHLEVAVRRKSPEKWRANSWFLLPDNAPTQRSVLVKVVLAKNVSTLEHPPYSPDLAPADFYMFPPLKSALKGRSFCDATDIIKNATEELKRLL